MIVDDIESNLFESRRGIKSESKCLRFLVFTPKRHRGSGHHARCYFFFRFDRGNLPRFFGPIAFCSSVADPSGQGAESVLIRFRLSGTIRRIGSIPPSAANAANAFNLFI
jgi:hypothetical protein